MIKKKLSLGIWGAIKLIILALFIETAMIFSIDLLLKSFAIYTDSPLLEIIPNFGALILVLKIAYDKYDINIMDNFNNPKRDLGFILPMLVTVLGLHIFISEVLNYVNFYFPMSDFWVEVFESAFGEEAGYLAVLVTTVIVAPIAEEILLRGVVLKGLLSRYSSFTAILVSSTLFGAIHGNLYQFVLALVIGIFFGWMFIKTRSLLLCILAHAFFNALSFITSDLLNLQIPGYTINGSQPLWFTLLGILLALIGIFLLKFKTSDLVSMNSKTYREFY